MPQTMITSAHGVTDLYDALFQTHPDAMVAVDPADRVVAVNDRALRDTGLKAGAKLSQMSGTLRLGERLWSATKLAQGSMFHLDDATLWALTPVEGAAPMPTPRSGAQDRFQLAPALIWSADPSGTFDGFNEQASLFTGRSAQELLGEGWVQWVHPEDQERYVAIYQSSVEASQPFSMDYRLRRFDGQYRWMLDSAVMRHGPGGEALGYVGACVDIHERKELEERLANHAQSLRLSERRQNEFLAMLCHQLRNPLAPIANAASVLRTVEGDNLTLQRLREIIDRQVGRLRRLVDDLVDVTRVMQGQITLVKTRVELYEVIKAAVESCRDKLDAAGHSLRLNLPDGPIWIQADAVRLSQALGNIILNASAHNQKPGVISVLARVQGTQVELVVRDDGQGIASEFLPYVFDLFSRQEMAPGRGHEGLGLGLPLARRVAQLHGGDVRAHSEGRDLGAEFVMSLPIAQGGIAPKASQLPIDGVTQMPSRRLLLIEEDPDARYLLRLQVELWGHQVAAVTNVEEALPLLDHFQPEAVLLDFDQATALNRRSIGQLKSALPSAVPFIALAGQDQAEAEANARATGCDRCIRKPLRPETLQRAVGSAGGSASPPA